MTRSPMIKMCSVMLAGFIIQFCPLVSEKNVQQRTTPLPPTSPVRLNEMLPKPQRQNVSGETIWHGQSGSLHIWWTTVDLYAERAGKVEGIWTPLAEKGFADFVAAEKAAEQPGEKIQAVRFEYGRRFEVLSVVGSLISFADHYSIFYGYAAPGLDTRFTTIDLAKQGNITYAYGDKTSVMDADLTISGKIVKLTDYFTEQDILRALLADPVVKKAIASLDSLPSPRTLAELPELFAKNGYELGDSRYELRPDFLTRFAFHHLEGNKVAVRIGLPPHYGFNKAQHQQLGLLLEIPPALRTSLTLASTRQEGFMMKDSAMISNRQTTKFSFGTNSR